MFENSKQLHASPRDELTDLFPTRCPFRGAKTKEVDDPLSEAKELAWTLDLDGSRISDENPSY